MNIEHSVDVDDLIKRVAVANPLITRTNSRDYLPMEGG